MQPILLIPAVKQLKSAKGLHALNYGSYYAASVVTN